MDAALRLLIIGGGPAGCSAAIMADSLGIECLLVERIRIACSVETIPNLANYLHYENGAQAAADFRRKVESLRGCSIYERMEVIEVAAKTRSVVATLHDDSKLEGDYCIVATGLRQAEISRVPWISSQNVPAAMVRRFSTLAPSELFVSDRLFAIGADRELGTFLRSLERDIQIKITVLYPKAEAYKLSESISDPRLEAYALDHLYLDYDSNGIALRCGGGIGTEHSFRASFVINNLGRIPPALPGLNRSDDGYGPPEIQDHRIITAGDLRGPRFQRVATAVGSGAEAALKFYYQDAGLLP